MMLGSINSTRFIVVATLLNLLFYHYPLYSFALSRLDAFSAHGILTLISLTLLSVMLTSVALSVLFFISTKLVKFVCIVFVLVNSIALYFMTTYKVVLDYSMIGNILNTQTSEASSYWHPTLLVYFLLLGLLPSWIIWHLKFKPVKRIKLIINATIIILVSVFWIYFNSSTWLWLDKYSKYVGGQIMPWSYVINTIRFQSDVHASAENQQLLTSAQFKNNDKKIMLLIIGETARKQNFSLYGYERDTNPLLAKDNVIALNNPSSCATYTTESVACILSHINGAAPEFEPLPSYLQRQGVDVIWHTKNWGEASINVATYKEKGDLKPLCKGEKCDFDEVLLSGLSERIAASKKNKILVVLHTKGSHGASYYSQYPKRFEQFKPVCKSVDLSECTYDELVNAYDNSILYTDYFIHQVILMLKQTKEASSLLYVSDHGESLGESGFYLHGTPMAFAPKEQTQIPFLVWMSEQFVEQKEIDLGDFKQSQSHSHANVFHSVMGALDMQSEFYKPKLDVFNQSLAKESLLSR